MDREYYKRNKKVVVEEISEVVALKLETKPTEPLHEYVKKFGSLVTDLKISDEELNGFNKADWLFVHPSSELSQAVERKEIPSGTTFVGRIFRNPRGRIMIGTDRLIVKLKKDIPDNEVQSILKENNFQVIRQLKFAINLFEVKVDINQDPLDISVKLHEDSSFIIAEPQMIEHIPPRFVPTDPDYNHQWQWNNDGSNGGTQGADINAESAWGFSRGLGVKVAVIDNGCDTNHPDLSPSIVNGAGHFDNDGNFVLGVNNFPDSDHGTFCSGMVIARANNDEGGCGGSNLADFLPIACLVDQVGTQVTLARAIAYAADPTTEVLTANSEDGADIISCSLGPNGADWEISSVLDEAINFAVENGRGGLGTPIFWAVSNGYYEIAHDEICSHLNTIAIGRSTRNDTEDGSAYGAELDFLAPGVDVYSTSSGGNYEISTGTSFATPCTASVAALILSVNSELSWNRIRQILRDTCDKIGGVVYNIDNHHDHYGYGRINAGRAVHETVSEVMLMMQCALEGVVK